MILGPGRWQGRGSLVVDLDARGTPLSCELDLRAEGETVVLEGKLVGPEANQGRALTLWVHPDDSGTWELHLTLGGARLEGLAKLASHPRLALLWAERPEDDIHVSCTLFPVDDGHGLRGILRHNGTVSTWEMALRQPRPRATDTPNVVSFRPRR